MSKKILTEATLIELANEQLKSFPRFMEGMKIESARMEKHILVMYGNCFLNEKGIPTEKTTPALEVYNEFAKGFSEQYTLAS